VIISLVLIGRDEAAHLGAALDHALAGAHDMDVLGHSTEVLFVDCGSRDTSLAIAYARPGVRVLSLTGTPLNAARARNLGIAEARGEFVQLLDGDMFVHPQWLPNALEALADEDLAAVGGRIHERQLRSSPWNTAFGMDWAEEPARPAILGGAALWRTASLRSLDGFDPTLRLGEDPDLYLRARAQGFEVARINTMMASHDLGLKSALAWWQRACSVGRSRACVFLKHSEDTAVRRNLRSPVLTLTALGLGFGITLFAGPTALGFLALGVAGIVLRHAVRAMARGTPLRQAFIHAVHVYAIKIPVALAALVVLLSPFRHGTTQ
jgi:GT2 family glycosyltransferase